MYPVSSSFNDKMKADRRQIFARVVIDYTDPFIDSAIQFSTNEEANISYIEQTADSIEQTSNKFTCLDGRWDITTGEYHLAPDSDRATRIQMGWWGAQFSDGNGDFTNPYPKLVVTHISRPIRRSTVIGDTARGEYPVDFTVKLYDADDVVIHTETVTGNDNVRWSKDFDEPILNIVKQELEITKWSENGTCVKIVEFFTSIREIYGMDEIVGINLLEEREFSYGSLPVGNISSNEISIALYNDNKKFDLDNENSPLKNLLKPNRRIQAWLGAETRAKWGDFAGKTWGEVKNMISGGD